MATLKTRNRCLQSHPKGQTWQPRFRVTLVSQVEPKPESSRGRLLRPALAFAMIIVVFWAGVTIGRSREAISRTPPSDSAAALEPFWETWNLAEKHYVGCNGAERRHLVQGAIKGLLDSLGD